MTSTASPAAPKSRNFRYADAPVEQVTADWIRTQGEAVVARAQQAGDDADAWIEVVRHFDEIDSHVSTHSQRALIRFRQEADSEDAAAEYRRISEEISPAHAELSDRIAALLMESPALGALEAAFGAVFVAELELARINNAPVNSKLRTKVDNTLMRHTELFGEMTITWRGEEHPWSYLRKALEDPDSGERRAAFGSAVAQLKRLESELQQIFDDVHAARLQMASNLDMDFIAMGYAGMSRVDWTPADAASFRAGVREHLVPLVEAIQIDQARQHGTDRLHPADSWLRPEDDQIELQVPIDQQVAATGRALDKLGTEFADPFHLLVATDRIDLPARSGKGPGAFCAAPPDDGVPFVFCNSVGSPNDLRTLLHEYGHALQAYSSRAIEPVSLRWPTAEGAEIHSMSMELLAAPHVAELVGAERLGDYLVDHLRQSLVHVPYMAAVDEFQHELYDPRHGNTPPTAADRGALWKGLAAQYLPGVDHQADPWWAQNRWLTQLHIFHYPFYYLDYALAQVVAWQVWTLSLDNRSRAHATYLELCRAGGTRPFRELVQGAGLADPFAPDTIAGIVERIGNEVPLR